MPVSEEDVGKLLDGPTEPTTQVDQPLETAVPVLEPGGDAAPVPVQQEAKPRVSEAEIQKLFDADQAQQDDALKGIFKTSLEGNPDKRASVLKLATDLQVPTDVVEKEYDHFKKTWDAAKFDPKAWREANPELSKLALDHPELGTVVVRDAQLSVFSKAWNKTLDVFSGGEGSWVTRFGDWLDSRVLESLPPEQREERKKILDSMKAENAAAREESRVKPKQETVVQDGKTKAVEGMSGLERALVVPTIRYGETKQQMDVSQMQWDLLTRRAAGLDTYDLQKKIIDAKREAVRRDYGEGPALGLVGDVAEAAASQIAVMKDAGVAAGAGAVAGGAIGFAITKTPQGAAQGALRGASMLGKAGLAFGSLKLEAGSAYGDLLETKTDDGQLLTETQARGAALLYGGLAAIVEMGATEQLLKSAGPLGEMLRAGHKQALLQELVKDGGFLNLAKKVGKEWLKEGLAEGSEEVIQSLLEDASTYLAKRVAAGKEQKGPVVDVEKALRAGEKGTVGGLGMGAATSSVHLVTQLAMREQSLSAGQQVKAVLGLRDSPTVKAAPAAVAQMIEEASIKNGERVTALHIDALAFQRLFQDEHADPVAAAAEMMGPDGPRRLQEAIATGGKLEVPIAEYLEKWGGTETAKRLAEDTTTQATRLTPRQLAEQESHIDAQAKKIAAEYDKEGAAAPTGDEAAYADTLEKQLAATGQLSPKEAKTQVNLHRAFIRAQAERFGVNPEELFRGVNVSAQFGEEAPVGGERVLHQDADASLNQHLSKLSAEDRARETYIDKNTGILNEKAFNQLKPEGKPLVGHISVEGIKFLNDNTSHDRADLLYRAVAKALHGVDPNVAKVGGDFAVHVADAGELKAMVDLVNESLPVKGFQVTGAVGETFQTATDAHAGAKQAAEKAGTRSERGTPPKGFKGDVKTLALPEDRAKATVPAQLSGPIAGLTDEQYFSQTYRDQQTGALTSEGWNAIPRKAAVAAFDLAKLSLANEVHGKGMGDAMILRMKQLAMLIGGKDFDFAHLHGDEYAAQHENVAQLASFIDALKESLDASPIEYLERETDSPAYNSLQFHYGIGADTYENADRNLNERKDAAKAAGAIEDPTAFPPKGAVDDGRGGSPGPVNDGGSSQGSDGNSGGANQGQASGEAGQVQEADPERLKKEALALIVRMKPDKQAKALEWFEYAEGIRSERPKGISDDLQRELAKYGVVDPTGYNFDELGRSLERAIAGPRVKGVEPAELRRQRLERDEHIATGQPSKTRYEQPPPPLPTKEQMVERAVAKHEARISQEPNEHAVIVGADGQTLLEHTSGHPSQVEFNFEMLKPILDRGDGVFTHNHPSSFAMSFEDLSLAHIANLQEMRSVGKDGSVYRVIRPSVGWGIDYTQVSKFHELRTNLREQQKVVATNAATQRMWDAITQAGGKIADGEKAVGYSHDLWRTFINEELVKAFNGYSEARGLGWQLESLSRADGSGETVQGDVRGQGDAGQQPSDVQGKRLFQPPQEKPGARGFTDIARDGLIRVFKIALNQNADLSTFLHESGHVFLEMFGDLAERGDAPEQVKQDYQQALEWLGVSSREDIATEHHEKWARGFEAYLLEGKAPSAKLAGAFERFKLWLKQIYQSAASLNVELNPEIRGVFDRMLATDAEIDRTQQAMGLEPLFRSPAEAGMSPEQWMGYLSDVEKATSTAQRKAELRVLKDRLRETESWWKEEEAKQRDAAGPAYDALPASRALGMLREGARLDPKAAAYLLGRKPDPKLQGVMKKGGLNPDDIADVFGFPTGRAMLEDLERHPSKEAWVKQKAAEAMQEKHPDVVTDRQAMREIAAKGLHGDHTASWLQRELQALRQKSGTSGPPVESIQRAAKQIVERRAVQRLDAGAALRSERAAADNALRAATEGNFAQAAAFKQQQLLNMFISKELNGARDLRDGFEALASKLADDKTRARLGKADPVFRDGTDSILEALGLKEPERREQAVASIGEVTSAMEDAGATVMFDDDAIAKLIANPKDWKQLSVSELRNVDGALRNIQAAARSVSTALVDGKRLEKQEVKAQLISEAQNNLKSLGPFPSSESAKTLLQKAGGLWNAFDGSLLKIETMAKWLAGGDLKSMWYRALIDPIQKAKAREVDLLNQTVKPILHAFEAMPANVKSHFMDKIDGEKLFPGHREDVAAPTRRFELLMMALNAGNESNLSRLMDGRDITEDQLRNALHALTRSEIDWVNSVWDANESLWPAARELEERDSGLAPEKIQPKPMALQNGTLKGGYFPAVYDRRVEPAGERQVANTVAGLMDPSFTRPATSRGHLKARVEGFDGAISLEPSNIPSHLAQVVHDIAYREAVKSVGGLVLSPDIQAVLKDRLGDGRASQFLQWVKDVGHMRGVDGAATMGPLLKVARAVRANTVIAALGYSAKNAIEDLSNLAAAVPRTDLKAGSLAAAVGEFAKSPMEMSAFVEEKSGEIRTRRKQYQRELAREVKKLTATGILSRGPLEWMKHHAFAFMEFSDHATSTPIWLGAYRQAIGAGETEAAAITKADVTVREVFPSHGAADMAGILRDKGFLGTSLVMYGFLNTYYNGLRDLGHTFSTSDGPWEKAKVGGRLLGYMMAVGVLSEFLRGTGRDPGEPQEQWFLRKLIGSGIASLPFGGDVANYFEDKVLGKKPNPRNTSLVTVGTNLYEAVSKLNDDSKDGDKRIEAFLRAIAPVAGIPVNQTIRTGKYLKDVASGDRKPRNPFDAASGLIYGARDGQPDNPFNTAGDAISGPRN